MHVMILGLDESVENKGVILSMAAGVVDPKSKLSKFRFSAQSVQNYSLYELV